MPDRVTADMLRQVGLLFTTGTVTGLTDRQLLDRFRTRRDEAAFEAIVARHGPMVLGVCRDLLRDPADADDAFQAAFLVLLRRSGSIRDRDGVGGWLHRVTCRIALRARRESSRRAGTGPVSEEPTHPDGPPEEEAIRRELRCLVRRELDCLPEKYRAPIVLCDLEGLTHDEAAVRLSWPVGTVKGRLSRGRDRLRDRLARRGVTAPALAVGAALMAESVRAAVPDGLIRKTVVAALALKTPGAVPGAAGLLAAGALRAMLWKQVGQTLGAIAAVGLIAGGVAAIGGGGSRTSSHDDAPPAPAANAGHDSARLLGTWRLVETEFGGKIERVDPTAETFNAMVIAADQQGLKTMRAMLTASDEISLFPPTRRLEAGPPSPNTDANATGWVRITPEAGDTIPGEGPADLLMRDGLYRLEGDTLTLCIGQPGQADPASLKPHPAGQNVRTVWKRVARVGVPAKPQAEQRVDPAELAEERAALEIREMELKAQKQTLSELIEERAAFGNASTDETARRDSVFEDTLQRSRARREARIHELEKTYLQNSRELDRRKRELEQREARVRPAPVGEPGDGRRIIAPGDFLRVELLEALPGRPIAGERVVRPDGTISLDFYGDLYVAGLDRREIKEKLIQHMRKYLTDESLGLVGQDPVTLENRPILPIESDRVVVDDSINYIEAARRAREQQAPGVMRDRAPDRIEAVEAKLDAILKRLDRIERNR